MSDVTLIHHPDDTALAGDVAAALQTWGFAVGNGGRAALIVWTIAAASDPGFAERAERAPSTARVSARFTPSRLPAPFVDEHPVNLLGWSREAEHAQWPVLLERLNACAFAPAAVPAAASRPDPVAPPPPPPPPPAATIAVAEKTEAPPRDDGVLLDRVFSRTIPRVLTGITSAAFVALVAIALTTT